MNAKITHMKYQCKNSSKLGMIILQIKDGDLPYSMTSPSRNKISKRIWRAAKITTTQLKMNQISHFLWFFYILKKQKQKNDLLKVIQLQHLCSFYLNNAIKK
jgi:hypothetical protein